MTKRLLAGTFNVFGCFGLLCAMLGCGAAPTRAQDPNRYKLVDSGSVSARAAPHLVECLTDSFRALNSGNTAFAIQQDRRAGGTRVEIYVSRVNLAVSADVFDDGRTELRMAPDPLRMFTKEPSAYRQCVTAMM
jgi:hypothetical protein